MMGASAGELSSSMATAAPQSFPPPHDLFEFYSANLTAEMCSPEDIFHHGRLLPKKLHRTKRADADTFSPRIQSLINCRRSESFSALEGQRRLGRVAELRRVASESARKPRQQQEVRTRPKWYVCLLGSFRMPQAMEMRDIRSRQKRRSTLAPEEGGRRGPWRLLRSLSCKGISSESPGVPAALNSD